MIIVVGVAVLVAVLGGAGLWPVGTLVMGGVVALVVIVVDLGIIYVVDALLFGVLWRLCVLRDTL